MDSPKKLTKSSSNRKTYYCGIDGSLACTRIVVIKKTEPGEEIGKDDVYRHWKVTEGTSLEFIEKEKNISIIEQGVNELMAEVTGTKEDAWKSVAMIQKVVIVFPQNKDKKMVAFERAFDSHNKKEKLFEELEVLPEVDVVALAHFQKDESGIALHCGVDSFCRFRGANELYPISVANTREAHAAGGAYWIARTALQMVIEEMERCEAKRWQKTDFIRALFKEHLFKDMKTTFAMNQELFNLKFKHRLAKITEILAEAPYKDEDEYMEKVRVKAEKVYRELKKREDPSAPLDCEEDSERFMLDFQDRMEQMMEESDEFKQEHERKLLQHDVIRDLFSRAGEHLGNLVAQTLSLRDNRQHHRELMSSGVPSEASSDTDSTPHTPTKSKKPTMELAPGLSTPGPSPLKALKPKETPADSKQEKTPLQPTTTKIVLFGRMFDSMELLESGLLSGLSNYRNHKQVQLYRMCEESAVVAAVRAAGEDERIEFDEPELLNTVAMGRDHVVEFKFRTMAERIAEAEVRLQELKARNQARA